MTASGNTGRSAAARLAAHESWARTADRAARPAPARAGLDARFKREARERLGPQATPQQIAAAAGSARKAYFARLSLASITARQRKTRH
jgi:hypothetical protein